MKKQPSTAAIEKAAQVWCKPSVSHKEMDSDLAMAFAETIDEIWSQAWLGNATTKELYNEFVARIDWNYKTVNE